MHKHKLIAAYVPVLHKGYLDFFKTYRSINELYVFDQDILDNIDYLRKDLRALSPTQQVQVIGALGRFNSVKKINFKKLKELDQSNALFVMPDEDISREVAQKLQKAEHKFHPVFLRWDRRSVEEVDSTDANETIDANEFQLSIMKKAMDKAGQSSDIWRRVGAILIASDGTEAGSATNEGEPTSHSPWMEGDPRNIFNRGVAIEMSVFTHAEANLIAEAARRGTKLQDGEIYVTTYPCPACAKLIAHSGLKICYYKDGYSTLDGQKILDEYGVKTIRVKINGLGSKQSQKWVSYKKTNRV